MSGRGVSPFDRLLKQQCNKGAVKAAGVVRKWGSASFTSLRGANGSSPSSSSAAPKCPPRRTNKFFKSRLAPVQHAQDDEDENENDDDHDDTVMPINPSEPISKNRLPKKRVLLQEEQPAAVPVSKPKRFFTSKQTRQETPPPPPPPEPESEPEPEPEPVSDTEPEADTDPEEEEDEPQEIDPEPEPPKVRPLKLRIKTGPIEQFKVVHSSSESEGRSRASSVEDVQEEVEADGFDEQEVTSASTAALSYSRRKKTPSPTPPPEPSPPSQPPREPSPLPEPVAAPPRSSPPPTTRSVRTYGTRTRAGPAPLPPPPRVPSPEPVREPTPPPVPKSKALKDDWGDDDEEGNNSSPDPDISFKDESLVTKSPSKTPPPAELKRAATVATSSDVSKELSKVESELGAKSDSQPSSDMGPPPPKKTRSIFKSRKAGGAGGGEKSKGMSLYRHKWQAEREEFKAEVFNRAVFGGSDPSKAASSSSSSDFDFADSEFGASSSLPPSDSSFSSSKLTRVASSTAKGTLDETSMEVTSVKCPRGQKDYYTVIRNVKKAHQIQDSGEFQEFNDDVEYILGGLGATNSLSTRCLSTVTLASKCMEPSFRMHLRAHGTVTQFFGELRDAPQNASLALCASTVLFVLSQDRLNMDLDRDSLDLMLNLLDTDSRIKDALEGSGMNRRELEKNKQKVRDLVSEMKKKGHAANLNLDYITADHLSMETLLSLTSKRAGEWFKEELRDLGGLDHLIRTLSECVSYLTADEISMWTEPLTNKLKKADRVLKVLESVTHENEENCTYLYTYKDGELLSLVHKLFQLLDEEVPLNPSLNVQDKETVAFTLRDALFDVLRLYINLVHDYHQQPLGSAIAGKKEGVFDAVLHCLFVLPESIPFEKRFDLHVLALTMIINMVENCTENRTRLMRCPVPLKADSFLAESDRNVAPQGLVELFLRKEEEARSEEAKTDNILDGVKNEDEDEAKEDEQEKTQEERIDETVAKLLHKAGRHMEDTLIASYITLIIGYLIIENKDHESSVRDFLPDRKFELMVTVLKKFFNFMNLTASCSVTSSRGIKATETIINHMEKIDKPPEAKVKEENEETFGDISLFDVTKDDDEDATLNEDHEED